MDIKVEWLSALPAWASQNRNIRELWLFGSYAKGTATSESDVDIAVYLVPPEWAFGAYVALYTKWQNELETLPSSTAEHISPASDECRVQASAACD